MSLQPNPNAIHPKVAGATVGGALAMIFVWSLKLATKIDIPDEIAQAIGIVFSAGIGYLTPS
jgi:glutamate formiminotransferase